MIGLGDSVWTLFLLHSLTRAEESQKSLSKASEAEDAPPRTKTSKNCPEVQRCRRVDDNEYRRIVDITSSRSDTTRETSFPLYTSRVLHMSCSLYIPFTIVWVHPARAAKPLFLGLSERVLAVYTTTETRIMAMMMMMTIR
ncbi:hypothetical protein JB92DRAFT_212256 [Gautieria morchelliformis]|nr:hypothetical protein JB92DRAFT_212256 [Gautieria morchelliformis]